MKHLHITFEDKEFRSLQNIKEERIILEGREISWREFILNKFKVEMKK